MKLSSILGFFSLVCASAAVVFYVLMPDVSVLVYGLWGATAVLALAWTGLNGQMILAFFTKKSTRYGANIAFVIFLVLGILVFINILGKEYNWRKDITYSGTNSLSPQTIKILKNLKQDIKVYYFNSLQEREKQEPLFKLYAYETKHFQYQFVDTGRQPTLTQSMDVKRDGTTVLVIESSNKRVKVDGATEEKLTNALMQLLRTKDSVVYFTVGHGEKMISAGSADPSGISLAKGELEKQGYVVRALELVTEGKIPSDAAAVVVFGPKSTFFPKEIEILSDWLAKGGKALFAVNLDVMNDGLSKGSKQLAGILKKYNIEVGNQMLVDPMSRAAKVEPQVLLGYASSKDHPITKDFPTSSMGVVANFFFPLTTYLSFQEKDGYAITPIVQTSAQAWAESDWAGLKAGSASFNAESDHRGVMSLALALEETQKPGEKEKTSGTKLVVFAAASIAENSLLDKAGNRDLLLNSVAWLASDEQFISIRAKGESAGDTIHANVNIMNFVFLLTVIVIPVLLMVGGIFVWWKRLKK